MMEREKSSYSGWVVAGMIEGMICIGWNSWRNWDIDTDFYGFVYMDTPASGALARCDHHLMCVSHICWNIPCKSTS